MNTDESNFRLYRLLLLDICLREYFISQTRMHLKKGNISQAMDRQAH